MKGLNSLVDLVRLLGLSLEELAYYRAMPENEKYAVHFEKKKSGGLRPICKPSAAFKKVQRALLDRVLVHLSICQYVHGQRGRSYVSNAKAHRQAKAAYVLDLERAFEQGTHSRLCEALDRHSLPEDVVYAILDLTLHSKHGIPQGAPTSNMMFNLLCWELDEELTRHADALKMRYTRYIDELTLSCMSAIDQEKRASIWKLVEETGFVVNAKKARYYHTAQGAIYVTGVSIFDSRVLLSKRKIEELRTLFHRALTDESITFEMVQGSMSQVRAVYRDEVPTRLQKPYDKAIWVALMRSKNASKLCEAVVAELPNKVTSWKEYLALQAKKRALSRRASRRRDSAFAT